jgi:hypothetical protein
MQRHYRRCAKKAVAGARGSAPQAGRFEMATQSTAPSLPVVSGQRLPVQADRRGRLVASRTGALALGALATGALAVGALAIGALAIGRLAIDRAAIGDLLLRRARARRMEAQTVVLQELIVERLTVREFRRVPPYKE